MLNKKFQKIIFAIIIALLAATVVFAFRNKSSNNQVATLRQSSDGIKITWITASVHDARVFDIPSDAYFGQYESIMKDFVKNYPFKTNDFCILGVLASNPKSKIAWVLWLQGNKMILWEGPTSENYNPLELSRDELDMKQDVVEGTEKWAEGSTGLVTHDWVQKVTDACNKYGTKVHLDKI